MSNLDIWATMWSLVLLIGIACPRCAFVGLSLGFMSTWYMGQLGPLFKVLGGS